MEIEIFPELKREIDAHRLSMHFHRSHPVAAFYEGQATVRFLLYVGQLTLTELDISDSLVTDISFGFVRLLTRLEQLSLQNTAITGRLLKVIRDLPTLRVLTCNPYVEASRWFQPEAICDCKTLKRLDLSHGHWTANEFGPFPLSFHRLSHSQFHAVHC